MAAVGHVYGVKRRY